MTDHTASPRGGFARWALSAAIVASVHAAAAAAMVHWRDPVIEPEEAAGAILVELAPEATSAPPLEATLPDGPRQIQADAAPRPVEKLADQPPEDVKEELAITEPSQEQTLELPRVDSAAAVLAAAQPPPPPPDPPQVEAAPPAPETTAPQATAARIAVSVAPTASVPSRRPSPALPQWSSRIAVHLERNKRYPATARSLHEQGTARVSFVLDRQGHLLSSRIETSSGVAALDQEALEILKRAQPFPALPAEVSGAQISLTVPIKFALR